MPPIQSVQSRTVMFADIPNGITNKDELFTEFIRATIKYYISIYGEVHRIWINQKDAPDDVQEVDGIKIERRGGCIRGKLMVM